MAIEVRRRRFRRWRVIGPLLLLTIAAVHVGAYPDQVEIAPYVGALFLLNAAIALALGAGVVRGNRWAWPAATAFAAVTRGRRIRRLSTHSGGNR